MGLIELLGGELQQEFSYDEAEDRAIVRTYQHVGPILERNRALYNEGDGYSPSRELRRVADIPNWVVHVWFKRGINVFDGNDWPKVAAMLDDPEWRWLRTATGRVSRRPFREFCRASTGRA